MNRRSAISTVCRLGGAAAALFGLTKTAPAAAAAHVYTARSPEGRRVVVRDLDGNALPASAACPAEGWVRMWALNPSGDRLKVLVDRKLQQLVENQVHLSYDLVDRRTEKVLHRVRWSMNATFTHQDLR